MAGTLTLVGTPIGNLGDLSPRARRALEEADFIAAEDTRVALKLLNHFGITKPLVSYYQHNKERSGERIVERILSGENCALVTDAGMPIVSDPGEDLAVACAEEGIEISCVPGPCAAVTALALSALPAGRFCFEGFLSTSKKSREEHLESLRGEGRTMIFYEAPHKLQKTLADLAAAFGPERRVSLCRELTKLHEEVLRGPAAQLAEELRARGEVKGEIALVIAPPSEDEEAGIVPVGAAAADPDEALREDIRAALEEGEPASAVAKRLSQKYSRRKRDVYAMVLDMQ